MGARKTAEGSYASEAGGTVGYFQAGGIDRPLVITKGAVSVVPHQNWRGQFARGTFASGARAGESSDCTEYPPTNGCQPISWPGWATTAWHDDAGTAPSTGYAHYWFGSQAVGMRDASGQMYMRNRYYDPATGQFTQPDPIGLAGGLNSYGFAAGDPVSYSDPYGLSPQDDCLKNPTIICRIGHWIGNVVFGMDEFDPESQTGELGGPGLADPVMLASGAAAGGLAVRAVSAGAGTAGTQALSRQLMGEAAQPTTGMLRQFSGQLSQHGRRSVERSIRRLEGRLTEHLTKVDDIVARGGDPGSVVREIRNFRRQIEAARRVLD